MFYLLLDCDGGGYVDENGNRFTLVYGNQVWIPGQDVNEGCERFDSIQDACEFFKITYDPLKL